MNTRNLCVSFAALALSVIVTLPSPQIAFCGETKDVNELTLAGIQPGSRFRWPAGNTSGAGRWMVKGGKFETPDAAYYKADSQPAIFFGEFPGREETIQWSPETTHILVGKNVLKGVSFDSDPNYPLTFRLVDGKGYVYLCGRGTVTAENGQTYRLGYTDSVDMWLPLLQSDDSLRAEAAAQALGYLATSSELKEKVVPELVAAARRTEFGVYWNASEALGRLGDARGLPVLEELKAKGGYIGRLAEESISKIKGERGN